METLPRLRNRYFALRHGSSEANARGIIVSDPRTGEDGYGLTAAGRTEVRDALTGWHEDVALIVTSPFRRARESASIARTVLGGEAPLVIDARLRERHFGALEGQRTTRYEEIWSADAKDPHHCRHGAEAAATVRSRAVDLILDLEREHAALCILLVAHGDTLQLLWTAFARRDAAAHRQRPPLLPAGLEEFRQH
ncbi:MAG: histidine phosphatase family protein [Gammaproteobacteria bacterium]|jgi:broad specificity phosphatase PhoE|nr:histidine phosphatase family protein [Gammaproteobacteria bacterium]